MRWSDERYARLYTRDSSNWVSGPWQARALLPLVLRKLDRAGVLELDDNGLDGLAAMVGLPVDVVEAGLPWWQKKGTIVIRGTTLVMPNYIEAQECTSSVAKRSREYRERIHATERGARETKGGAPATTSNEAPRDATARHEAPLRAVPSVPYQPPERETLTTNSETAVTNRDVPSSSKEDESEDEKAPAAAPPTPAPASSVSAVEPPRRLPPGVVAHEAQFLIAAYERAATKSLGYTWVFDREQYGAQQRLGALLAHCPNKPDAEAWLELEVEVFIRCADDKQRERGFGVKELLEWQNKGRPRAPRSPAPAAATQPMEPPSTPEQIDQAIELMERMKGFGSGGPAAQIASLSSRFGLGKGAA